MKVAISSNGKDLESLIDPRFGRCDYFLIVKTDDMDFEVFDNQSRSLGGGAGIQSAQFVASKGVRAVITGHCGPNAVRTLSAAGIELFLGNTGSVKGALEKYKNGRLSAATEPDVPEYSGLNDVPGDRDTPMGGRGRMGRGMGPGGGTGMGRGNRGQGRTNREREMGGGLKMSGGRGRGGGRRKR